MSDTFHRFSTYEFEADQSLLAVHLPDSTRVHDKTTRHATMQPRQEAPQASPWEGTRVHTGTLSMTMGGDDLQLRGHARHSVSYDGTAGGSVAGTARHAAGTKSVELIPGNPNSRTSVENAERMGLIERDGRGGWRDVVHHSETMSTQETSTAPSEAERAPEAPEASEGFDREDLSLWSEDIAPLEQQVYYHSVARSIEAVAAGQGLERVAVELARSAGLDPALASEYVQAGTAMYQRAVDRDLARVGIVGEDLAEFYSHLRSKEPAYLRHALQRLAMQHDTSEFKRLGMSWQAARMRQSAGRRQG